ncbi:hypothetical protein MKX03_027191 [Papaver bracteatum]|nr:hypothetical protein MKX03_027191 [Papaver bracteatum]
MEKAHHLSFFSTFLVGLFMVFFVSDFSYVRSQSCYPQGYFELHPGEACEGNELYPFIYCPGLGITFDATSCGYNPETGNEVCICCING